MIHDANEHEFFRLIEDNKPRHLCFDIETGPEPDEILRKFFDASKIELPPPPGEFDSAAVALGNRTDPAKISNKILAAREKHLQIVKTWAATCQSKKTAAWQDFVNGAPLSALYGRVLAIGYGVTEGPDVHVWLDINDDEQLILTHFWRALSGLRRRGDYAALIAHNGNRFDLPFIVRRSWKYGIKMPRILEKDKWWPFWIKDTREVWGFGDKFEKSKLDHLAKMLNVPGKLEGVTGDLFWKLLRDGDLDVACEYLRSDIVALHGVAQKMGLVP